MKEEDGEVGCVARLVKGKGGLLRGGVCTGRFLEGRGLLRTKRGKGRGGLLINCTSIPLA